MKDTELLRAIYSETLRTGGSTAEALARDLSKPVGEVRERLRSAQMAGLVESGEGSSVRLTESGRAELKVVMIGGAFEIIHPGHLHTITDARKLGDTLVVVVATDKSVLKNKGREPVTTQDLRVGLVSAIRSVDIAVPGGQGSIYDTLAKVKPDVVALGYDQLHDPVEIEKEARKRGLSVRVVRLSTPPLPDVKTSKIVNTL